MLRLTGLHIRGPVSPWESLGFVSRPDVRVGSLSWHRIELPGLTLTFVGEKALESGGIGSWTFSTDEEGASRREISVDGIASVIEPDSAFALPDDHRLAVTGIDHVVVMTGSLDRTCGAITEAIGEPVRRIRDAGRGVRQGFHRSGSVIIEVVERPDLASQATASLWGLVMTVEDLDAAVQWLGPDAIGSPREAVQPGRRIATLRSEVGLGVPLALMTPHVKA